MLRQRQRRDEHAGYRESLTRLRAAQKSGSGAPLYSLVVNRPLGRVLAAAAHQGGLTPNQVTGLSALFTFTGIGAIALGPATVATGVGVAALLVLGYALDAADGQLARLRGGGSTVGEWLDHLVDSIKVVVLHLVVAVCLFRSFDLDARWLLVPLAFAAASSVHFFGMVLVDLLARVQHSAHGLAMPKRESRNSMMSIAKVPTDYGVLCLSFALLGWHSAFLIVYSLLALAMVGYTVLVIGKWRRDVEKLDSLAGLDLRTPL